MERGESKKKQMDILFKRLLINGCVYRTYDLIIINVLLK